MKSDFVIFSCGFDGKIFGFLLELGVGGGHTQKTREEAYSVLEIAHFLGLGLFAHKTLLGGVANKLAGLTVRTFVGENIDSATSGGAEHRAGTSKIDTECTLHDENLIYK